jgi:hypothetical protein
MLCVRHKCVGAFTVRVVYAMTLDNSRECSLLEGAYAITMWLQLAQPTGDR